MKINKSDIKDGLTFLWVSMIFLTLTIDVVYPFITIIIKIVFYVISVLLGGLGIATLVKAFFGKNDYENINSQKK